MTTKTNQKINQSNVVLGDKFLKALTVDSNKSKAADVARGELITRAIDNGIDFTKKTMSKEQIKQAIQIISLRFPKDAQTLLSKTAAEADGAIAACFKGERFNTQGRPKDWAFWNNKAKRIMKQMADAIVTRGITEARIAKTGNKNRSLVERLSDECNKLFNAVIVADVDTLSDDFDTEEVIAGFKTVAKNAGFQLVKKAK